MEPEVGQRREKDGEISSTVAGKKSGNVLNEEPPAGSQNPICDAGELEEEAAPLTSEPPAASGDAEVLAGEAAAEQGDGRYTASVLQAFSARVVPGLSSIHARDLPRQLVSFSPLICQSNVCGSHGSDVGVAGDSGPSLREDSPAPLVGLALPRDAEASSLEAKVEASDTAEAGSDGWHVTGSARATRGGHAHEPPASRRLQQGQ